MSEANLELLPSGDDFVDEVPDSGDDFEDSGDNFVDFGDDFEDDEDEKAATVDDPYAHINTDEEYLPLIVSMGQYKLFMSRGPKGRDAMLVFLHLLFTARLQATNQVRATGRYIEKGVFMGAKKVRAAKALLVQWGMIEYVRDRRTDGSLGDIYIKLRYLHRADTVKRMIGSTSGAETAPVDPPVGQKTTPVVTHPTGSDRQMLKVNKGNASSKKEKESPEPSLSQDSSSQTSSDQDPEQPAGSDRPILEMMRELEPRFRKRQQWTADQVDVQRRALLQMLSWCKELQPADPMGLAEAMVNKHLELQKTEQFWQSRPIQPRTYQNRRVFDQLLELSGPRDDSAFEKPKPAAAVDEEPKVCAKCGEELLVGEVGMCDPCISKQVRAAESGATG